MEFQEYYIERAGSQKRIANKKIAPVFGKYDLLVVHVGDSCSDINQELKKILDAKKDDIQEKILIEFEKAPDFLKPTQTYGSLEMPEFKGNKYILTGWDLRACMVNYYELLLSQSPDSTVEINIPFGAAEYEKLESEGGREDLDNIIYYSLITYYLNSAIKSRGTTALYFDGSLIDLNNQTATLYKSFPNSPSSKPIRIGKDPNAILKFYSTTEKFLELSN